MIIRDLVRAAKNTHLIFRAMKIEKKNDKMGDFLSFSRTDWNISIGKSRKMIRKVVCPQL